MTEQHTSAATGAGLYVTAGATIAASDLPAFYANVGQWLLSPQTGKSAPRLVGEDDHVTAVATIPADQVADFYLAVAQWLGEEPDGSDPPRGKSSPR